MKLLREAKAMLASSGLPYEFVEATAHTEVILCGVCVLVLARSDRGRNLHKLRSAIARAHRGGALGQVPAHAV